MDAAILAQGNVKGLVLALVLARQLRVVVRIVQMLVPKTVVLVAVILVQERVAVDALEPVAADAMNTAVIIVTMNVQ